MKWLIQCAKISLFCLLTHNLPAQASSSELVYERFSEQEIQEIVARDLSKTSQTLVNFSFDREEAPDWFVQEYGEFTFGSYGAAYIHLGRKFTESDLNGLIARLSEFESYPEIKDRKGEILFHEVEFLTLRENGDSTPAPRPLRLDHQESATAELRVRIPVWGPFTTRYRAEVIMERQGLNLFMTMLNSSAIQILFTRLMDPEEFVVDLEVYPVERGVLIYVAIFARPALEDVSMTAEFFSRYGESTSDWIEAYLRNRR